MGIVAKVYVELARHETECDCHTWGPDKPSWSHRCGWRKRVFEDVARYGLYHA